MTKHGYKVVRQVKYNNKTQYLSATMQITDNYECAFVNYIPGKKVYPHKNHGPLCVFKTLRSAIMFRRMFFTKKEKMKIFRCEYEPSDNQIIWTTNRWFPRNGLPDGSDLAKWVKIKRFFW